MQEDGISARLTFSNSLLRQEHLLDRKCNTLCRLFEKKNTEPQNGVIIYSELLLKYIKKHYPGILFRFFHHQGSDGFYTSCLRKKSGEKNFCYVVPDFRLNKTFDQFKTPTQAGEE